MVRQGITISPRPRCRPKACHCRCRRRSIRPNSCRRRTCLPTFLTYPMCRTCLTCQGGCHSRRQYRTGSTALTDLRRAWRPPRAPCSRRRRCQYPMRAASCLGFRMAAVWSRAWWSCQCRQRCCQTDRCRPCCRPRRSLSAGRAVSGSSKHAVLDSLLFLSTNDDVVAFRLDWTMLHKFQHTPARSASRQTVRASVYGRPDAILAQPLSVPLTRHRLARSRGCGCARCLSKSCFC